MFSASQSCRFTAQVQYHRNSVTQLHSHSTAGAAVFVVGVCMCVFVCVHGRGQLSKATTNMATEVVPCSFVYLCCCVFFVMQAYTLFIFLKKERKKQNPNKPQNHYRKSGSKLYLKKKKKICAMQVPDWITHHITVVALYVCVHACVWRRRGGRNGACRIKKVQRVQNGQDDEQQKRNWTCGDETEITSGRWRQPNSQREKEMGLPMDVSINILLCWDPLFLIHSPLIKTSAVIQFLFYLDSFYIYYERSHKSARQSLCCVSHLTNAHVAGCEK